MRKWNALLRGAVAEIQITRQRRRGSKLMMIKNHRQSRKRSQRFAADAGGEIYAREINRCSADRADAIETQLHVVLARDAFQLREIVKDASGRFAVRAPHPVGGPVRDAPADFGVIERLAPLH